MHIERAAKIDSQNLPWRVNAARVLAERGELREAIAELEQIVALDPGLPDAHKALGAMLAAVGEHLRAAAEFGKLIELTPDDLEANFGFSLSLLRTGSYRASLQALEAGVSRFPDDPGLTYLLAQLLASCPEDPVRDGQRALTLAEKLMREQPTIDHAETLAMALAEVGRFDEAVQLQLRILSDEGAATGKTSPERRARLQLYEAGRPYRVSPSGP